MTRNNWLDKKLLGTLFEEEEITKKDNFQNMDARDLKGHKHFHGAFEGGFEAGYKNTAGSKQGWAPQKFLSTRTNRAQYTQSIRDYMDEEDIGHQKLGVNVTIQPAFDTFGNNEINFLQQQLGSGWLMGTAPEELVYRDNKSLGYQALQAFRKRMPQKDDEEQQQEYDLRGLNKSNTQFTGVGYNLKVDMFDRPSNPLEQTFWTFLKQNTVVVQQEDEEQRKKDNRINMNGKISEIQEDYYQELPDDDEEFISTKKVKGAINIGMQFNKDLIPLRMDVQDYTITVPEKYDPYHKAKELLQSGIDSSFLFINKTSFKKPIQSSKREEIFREEETPDQIRKDANSQKFVKASSSKIPEDPQQTNILNLFPHQPEKQQKYATYVQQKLNLPYDSNIILEEFEKQDFERLYQMFQVSSKNIITPKGEQQQEQKENKEKINPFLSKRVTKRWVPDDLFCKRMGIHPPYNEEEKITIQKMNQRAQRTPNLAQNNRDFLIMDKKEFTSAGYIQPLDSTQSNAYFDPVALGLPLSFKSHSYERNQPERLQQIANIERSQTIQPTKQDINKAKYAEDAEEAVPSRIVDQNIFDLIFGDESDE